MKNKTPGCHSETSAINHKKRESKAHARLSLEIETRGNPLAWIHS